MNEPQLEYSKVRSFRLSLITFGREGQVGYPWRRARSPYNILIAELMLQRTGVGQVLNVYEDFLVKYPDANTLNGANTRTLKHLLEPLGRTDRYTYFSRIAQILSKRYVGQVPDNYEELLQLPGVGPYSARAVLCFGFGKRVGLLDPNVYRVVSRVFSVNSEKERPHTDKRMWLFVDRLLPKKESGIYNEALIDLGRTVCIQREPRHHLCVLRGICDFAKE